MPRELTILQRSKNRILPTGPRLRRLPLGIGRGLRLTLDFRHHTKLYLGLYEIELNPHLRRLCRPGSNCFDVGGQIGYDALVLAKLGGGRVTSFECDPEMCKLMRASFDANSELAGGIDVREAFVARTSDPARGRLALDDVAFGPHGYAPQFIKMDIEGGELDALLGAQRLLEVAAPSLLVEVHSSELERDCLELLRRLDYAPEVVPARRWVRDNRPTGHNRWLVAESPAKPR